MNTITMIAVAITLAGVPDRAAAVDPSGEPDSVWVLVNAAAGTDDEGERKRLLREAEDLARTAVTEHEADTERRYLLAVVLGLRATAEGGQTKVRVAAELSEQLDAILATAPNHAGARHLLGRLHAGVRRMNRITRWIATNLLGGDELKRATWEAAEENLVFAERNAPEVADHHLQLALLYRDTGRSEFAVQELWHVMDMGASTAMELLVRQEAMEVWSDLAP
jgi:hypothetical protein